MFNGLSSDLSCSKILKFIRANDLVIRDLSYFSLDVFRKIIQKKAFFISKLHNKVNIYLSLLESHPLDLLQFLKTNAKNNPKSLFIYLGAQKNPYRMVYEKAPDKVVRQRLKRYKKERGKEPSEHYREMIHYSILITNVPQEMLCDAAVFTAYKLRWQVELFFKNIKSNLHINVMDGKSQIRILNLIYGRLIGLIILSYIFHQVSRHQKDREVSFYKLTKWLVDYNRLCLAILNDRVDKLLKTIIEDIKLHCKQKRKRKTSREEFLERLVA